MKKNFFSFFLFLGIVLFGFLFLFFSKSHFYCHKSKMKKKIIQTLSREIKTLYDDIDVKKINDEPNEYKPIVVQIASYNNEKFCEKNLSSVFEQRYPNFRVIYTDDYSNDGTYEKVKALIKKYQMEDKVTLIRNDHRCLAMQNHYHAIHSCKDDEIIVMLDGDDWFAHERVLNIINQYYQDPNVWVTYGRAIETPNYNKICGVSLASHLINKGKIRESPFVFAMPRSFYAGLFKKIKAVDFLYKRKFFPMSCDLAIMIDLVEMAGFHSVCLNEILYVINRTNPINDCKVDSSLQVEIDRYIRSQTPYFPLKSLSFTMEIPPYYDIICFLKENIDSASLQKLTDSWRDNLEKIRSIHIVLPSRKFSCSPLSKNIFVHFADSFNLFDNALEITPYVLVLDEKSIFSDKKNVIEAIKKMKMTDSEVFLLQSPNIQPSSLVELPKECFGYLLEKEELFEIFSKGYFNRPMIIEKTSLSKILMQGKIDANSLFVILEKDSWIKDE